MGYFCLGEFIMQINKKIRSGKADIDSYIEELEAELTKKETSAITSFILNANRVAKILSSDLGLLAEGRDTECVLINESKDDKRLERVLALLKNVDTFDSISKIADSLTPEEIDQANEGATQLNPTSNAFEQLQDKAWQKFKQK